tara:strand:+ start:31 stop:306 length:276 start_codon:yes stop_codon:yes gene_type:complete
MNLAQFRGYEKEIEQISNYINGDDYPDEIPYRIMGLFMREHKTLLAEVERLQRHNQKLGYALLTLSEGAGDDPMFNKGGAAYEALFGDDEE